MSSGSEIVKAFRKRTKLRIVEAMGGSCVCCGYQRCTDALELHHIDPSLKECSIGSFRSHPRQWKLVIEELRKCVLVCSICHREIHAGIRELSEDAPRFNERYADYQSLVAIVKLPNLCGLCGKSVEAPKRFCDTVCSHANRHKVDWSKYDLLTLSETMSNSAIGRMIGVSDVTIHKRLKRLRSLPP